MLFRSPELTQIQQDYLTDRYVLPQPRVRMLETLQEFASASMDISDGLVGDLEKFCMASEVAAHINVSDIPFSNAAAAATAIESTYLETALTGGDDYEILFTVPQGRVSELEDRTKSLPFPVTGIGKVQAGKGISLFDSHGHAMRFKQKSYDHGAALK